MTFKIILLFSISIFIGCGKNSRTNIEISSAYFEARNSMEYEVIKDLINDSLIVVEGDYVMPYSQESYYEVFKWDSIFQTKYTMVEFIEEGESVIASINLSSIRNRFLKNDEMTCQFKISFHQGKISKIESLDCKNANWEIWQERVGSLVDWVNLNHPDLNGFIHDMTMNGASNYLKTIELYELNEDRLSQ